MPATTEFLPSREADLLAWSQNFDDRLQAGAVGGIYGLDPAQIAEYNVAFLAFSSAWTAANQNSTRTPDALTIKDLAKKTLIEKAREFAAYIQGNPATTDAERSTLQITIRDTEPTPAPIPAFPPSVTVDSASGTMVNLRLRDVANPNSRGKPAGVMGANVLTAFGAAPPDLSDPSLWTMQGTITRTLGALDFAGQPSGTTAWITAYWINTRGDAGPPAQPISVQIPGQLAA